MLKKWAIYWQGSWDFFPCLGSKSSIIFHIYFFCNIYATNQFKNICYITYHSVKIIYINQNHRKQFNSCQCHVCSKNVTCWLHNYDQPNFTPWCNLCQLSWVMDLWLWKILHPDLAEVARLVHWASSMYIPRSVPCSCRPGDCAVP